MKRHLTPALAIAMTACTALTACSDDETTPESTATNIVITAGDPESDLTGGVYLKVYSDKDNFEAEENVYGDTEALKSADSFTQVIYNKSSKIFTGYIYARGASAEGIGTKKAGLRSYSTTGGVLSEVADPVLVSAFGNTGCFGTYSYAAQISQPYAMVVDANGAGNNIAVGLTDYAIDEVNPNISNIVDMGDNQVAMVLNYSNYDAAVVAICDYDLKIQKFIKDTRIGTSVGAQRSVRYTQSGADDNGNIYVFCGSSETDSKVGALRIKKGETEFDQDYQFDILSASDGYRFRKAFHISGDKFLLEFYTSKESYGNMDASGKMAIVDVTAKTLTWVSGLPDASTVSFGWGDGLNGYYYLPVSAPTSMSGGSSSESSSVIPTVYKIDANTGNAIAFMTFSSGNLLKAITFLK